MVGTEAGPRIPGLAQSSERATLETVRKLVARNEALVNPIKIKYTVRLSQTGERQIRAVGGRRLGRSYSHINCVWAQDVSKQYAQIDHFYSPSEPARSTVIAYDGQLVTEGRLSDLMHNWQVFQRIAQLIPQMTAKERPEMLWQPILDLGPMAHYWIENFLSVWILYGPEPSQNPERFVQQ